ncbi:hypothetical protein LAZ67_10003126 [Cordylochernes scorpioides]|uniref:Mos1 transposase HTH domain-containing protein n=1 Tax=Cordylochernes scorpioides TaxID=51811 RepID=A0ABY6KX06_9ARAC|nr:hypothetical protein LAZ67_10003126 [Cordylochernes scorpioides]
MIKQVGGRVGFHRRVKAKTSFQDDDIPIDDMTTNPFFTPQEKGYKGTMDRVPRLRRNPWQKHLASVSALSSFEQRANIKFRMKLKNSFTETLALMNEAYEDERLPRTQVYFWYKRFKDGRKSIADDSRSGRPLTSTTDRNIGQVRDSIVAGIKITIDNISEILGISKKKVRLDKSKGKVMLVVVFDYQGLVYYEFIKEGVTINKQAYKEILLRLPYAIKRKRNQLFKSKQWKLLRDNAPAHRAIIVQDYLAKHSVSVLPHPLYSPDIAPCDFFFFTKLKMTLKGRRFSSSSEVIENATVELNKLRKFDFELAFQQLFSRWKKNVLITKAPI